MGSCARGIWRCISSPCISEKQVYTRRVEVLAQQLLQVLHVKLANWSKLPWGLCGLAHPVPSTARALGQKCIQQFESWWNGSEDAVMHHKLTMVFLHFESIVRQQLNFIVRRKPLRLLLDLYKWVCRLKLIPVSERQVEAPHSERQVEVPHALVHKFALHKHCGPLTLTMSVRGNELCEYAQQEEIKDR